MNPATAWNWPLSWRVRPGEAMPYHLLLHWHYHCLLKPRGYA